jgi:hypothetical protein
VAPSPLVSLLLGAPLTGTGLVAARLAGGGLLALGIACWFARSTPTARSSVGVAVAFLIYNLVACVTLALATPVPVGRFLPLAASALHALLALGLLVALVARNRAPAT